jgi:hypothetical protein
MILSIFHDFIFILSFLFFTWFYTISICLQVKLYDFTHQLVILTTLVKFFSCTFKNKQFIRLHNLQVALFLKAQFIGYIVLNNMTQFFFLFKYKGYLVWNNATYMLYCSTTQSIWFTLFWTIWTFYLKCPVCFSSFLPCFTFLLQPPNYAQFVDPLYNVDMYQNSYASPFHLFLDEPLWNEYTRSRIKPKALRWRTSWVRKRSTWLHNKMDAKEKHS